MEKMQFKIVKIVDENSVVVNAGTVLGIKEGDLLDVFELGDEVFDPETNEFLGTLDFIKAKLKVVNAYPKMSLCKNREFEQDDFSKTLSKTFFLAQKQPAALPVDSIEISGGFEKRSKKISIGDLVRKSI